MRSARNHLLKAIHCYPSDSDLHDQLIALSINSLQANRDSILRLSQSVTAVHDLVGLASLAAGHVKQGLKWAQNAVHLYPGQCLIHHTVGCKEFLELTPRQYMYINSFFYLVVFEVFPCVYMMFVYII